MVAYLLHTPPQILSDFQIISKFFYLANMINILLLEASIFIIQTLYANIVIENLSTPKLVSSYHRYH